MRATPTARLRILAFAIALIAQHAALAAPVPGPHAGLGRARERAWPGESPEAGARTLPRCGASPDGLAGALADHEARALNDPLPTPHSIDAGEIAVLEDDGTFFYTNKGNDVILDLESAARAFYRTHGDDYDFIAFYLASGHTTYLGSPTALASAFVVRNPTQGIGLDTFDDGREFGSTSRLQSMLSMNGIHLYADRPDSSAGPDDFSPLDFLAHELGHRWLAYVDVDSAGTPVPALLGRGYAHWNFFFDCDASVMEGCDWARLPADSFATDSVTVGYGALDLYLMGLASKAETDSFFVVNDPHDMNPPDIYVPYSIPAVGVGCNGRATWWHVSDIEGANGPRVPDAASAPHAFRMAVALVTARDSAASAADLAKLEAIRSQFPAYFEKATRYHGTIDLTLDSHAGRVCIAHQNLGDIESALQTRPVGARVSIAQGGIPIALDPGSVELFWRPAGGGAFDSVAFAPAGADSFAATFPAAGTFGTVEYYLHAASDSSGIDAFDPPSGPLAPYTFEVGPDLTPPVIVHVPVQAQGAARMPQTLIAKVTDNLGVDSVWVEFATDGGPAQSAAATSAGRDSFKVALGGGLASGQRLAYRFVARDASAAHGIATSSAGYDTLLVGRDWTLDFENGAEGMLHQIWWYSYRDAWHLTQEASSPPGGTAWKCGGGDSTAYPVHLDANLYLPVLTDIVPGTVVRFDHRYGLEQADAFYAWDGARLEISVDGGAFQALTPLAGYSHVLLHNSNPFVQGSPCWSGDSPAWRTETVDLTPYAGASARIRFRMLADDFTGGLGWFVDRVRVLYPGPTAAVAEVTPRISIGRPWPNPSGGSLRLAASLPRASDGEWSLYDLAGRRVATLWRGLLAAGRNDLSATLPPGLRSGLYFTQLNLGGRVASRDRIALVR
jgi:hypothetical protein